MPEQLLRTITIVFKPGGPEAERATYQISEQELQRLARSFLEHPSDNFDVVNEAGETRQLSVRWSDVLYVG